MSIDIGLITANLIEFKSYLITGNEKDIEEFPSWATRVVINGKEFYKGNEIADIQSFGCIVSERNKKFYLKTLDGEFIEQELIGGEILYSFVYKSEDGNKIYYFNGITSGDVLFNAIADGKLMDTEESRENELDKKITYRLTLSGLAKALDNYCSDSQECSINLLPDPTSIECPNNGNCKIRFWSDWRKTIKKNKNLFNMDKKSLAKLLAAYCNTCCFDACSTQLFDSSDIECPFKGIKCYNVNPSDWMEVDIAFE